MKSSSTCLLAGLVAVVMAGTALAQLQLLPDSQPQAVFGGGRRALELRWRNAGNETMNGDVSARLLQASSATVVLVSDSPWKKLQVLPGQTVVESATLDFPAVRAETRFLIQWIESVSNIVGRLEVLVYPTNLLQELKALAGEQENALGIYDPQNQLKSVLKTVSVEFADLEDVGLEGFHGKLAIVGPFAAKKQMREGLPAQIELLAKKGASVVWLQPPPGKRDKLSPSFYTVPVGEAAVVVAQAELVANLAEHPQSQLNLIHFARLALRPEPPRLPSLSPQPRNPNEL
ncbi:MAG: hypothetical protein U1F83_14490 [Verrucomicrobiota bacterium]